MSKRCRASGCACRAPWHRDQHKRRALRPSRLPGGRWAPGGTLQGCTGSTPGKVPANLRPLSCPTQHSPSLTRRRQQPWRRPCGLWSSTSPARPACSSWRRAPCPHQRQAKSSYASRPLASIAASCSRARHASGLAQAACSRAAARWSACADRGAAGPLPQRRIPQDPGHRGVRHRGGCPRRRVQAGACSCCLHAAAHTAHPPSYGLETLGSSVAAPQRLGCPRTLVTGRGPRVLRRAAQRGQGPAWHAQGEVVATAMGGMGREWDGGYAEFTCAPARQVQVRWCTRAPGAAGQLAARISPSPHALSAAPGCLPVQHAQGRLVTAPGAAPAGVAVDWTLQLSRLSRRARLLACHAHEGSSGCGLHRHGC